MLDFALDGGMSVQQFEGVDYADKSNRKDGEKFAPIIDVAAAFDVGKRERKTTEHWSADWAEPVPRERKDDVKQKKLPAHMRLPGRMETYQFYPYVNEAALLPRPPPPRLRPAPWTTTRVHSLLLHYSHYFSHSLTHSLLASPGARG